MLNSGHKTSWRLSEDYQGSGEGAVGDMIIKKARAKKNRKWRIEKRRQLVQWTQLVTCQSVGKTVSIHVIITNVTDSIFVDITLVLVSHPGTIVLWNTSYPLSLNILLLLDTVVVLWNMCKPALSLYILFLLEFIYIDNCHGKHVHALLLN